MSDFIMEKHSTPIRGHYDVIVCGAVRRVCAAISAANQGSKVLLIERGGCLGGIWTGGLLSWIMTLPTRRNSAPDISTLEERNRVMCAPITLLQSLKISCFLKNVPGSRVEIMLYAILRGSC